MESYHIDGVVIYVCYLCLQDKGKIKAFPYQVLKVRECR